jgi:hypothetical protein
VVCSERLFVFAAYAEVSAKIRLVIHSIA